MGYVCVCSCSVSDSKYLFYSPYAYVEKLVRKYIYIHIYESYLRIENIIIKLPKMIENSKHKFYAYHVCYCHRWFQEKRNTLSKEKRTSWFAGRFRKVFCVSITWKADLIDDHFDYLKLTNRDVTFGVNVEPLYIMSLNPNKRESSNNA